MIITQSIIVYGTIENNPKSGFILLSTLEYGLISILNIPSDFNKKQGDTIGINTEVKQNVLTREIIKAEYLDVLEYSKTLDTNALEEMIKIGTEAWKDVKDVNEYLKEIRGIVNDYKI